MRPLGSAKKATSRDVLVSCAFTAGACQLPTDRPWNGSARQASPDRLPTGVAGWQPRSRSERQTRGAVSRDAHAGIPAAGYDGMPDSRSTGLRLTVQTPELVIAMLGL